MHFGRLILQFLEKEFAMQITSTRLQEPCVWCELRRKRSEYALPCRHTINFGYIINLDFIHKRFLRVNEVQTNLPNTIAISNTPVTAEKSRNGILVKLDPFVNMYGKDESVNTILDNEVNDLEGLQVHPNKGMPPTLD